MKLLTWPNSELRCLNKRLPGSALHARAQSDSTVEPRKTTRGAQKNGGSRGSRVRGVVAFGRAPTSMGTRKSTEKTGTQKITLLPQGSRNAPLLFWHICWLAAVAGSSRPVGHNPSDQIHRNPPSRPTQQDPRGSFPSACVLYLRDSLQA